MGSVCVYVPGQLEGDLPAGPQLLGTRKQDPPLLPRLQAATSCTAHPSSLPFFSWVYPGPLGQSWSLQLPSWCMSKQGG